MVFILLKNRDARYTVSGTNSSTRLRNTSSFCSHVSLFRVAAVSARSTHPIAIRVVEGFQLDDIGVPNNTHNLKLAVLSCVSISLSSAEDRLQRHLKSFVLKNTFDGGVFAIGSKLGMKDHSEGPVAYDFALSILHFLCLPGNAILNLLSNDLCAKC